MNIKEFDFPPHVQEIIDNLKREESTISIWLFGSRANGNFTEVSDWDILVFSETEPFVTGYRHEKVDVMIVGMSGRCLLEGQTADNTLSFKDWCWCDNGDGTATYTGKRFIDYDLIRDISEPLEELKTTNSYCLFNR